MGIPFIILITCNKAVFNIGIFQPAWYQLRSIIQFAINQLFNYQICNCLRSCLWNWNLLTSLFSVQVNQWSLDQAIFYIFLYFISMLTYFIYSLYFSILKYSHLPVLSSGRSGKARISEIDCPATWNLLCDLNVVFARICKHTGTLNLDKSSCI